MRILLVAPFLPWPLEDGGRVRVYHVLRGLAARHEVELLALAPATEASRGAVEALRDRGYRVRAVPHDRSRAGAALLSLATGRSLYASLFSSRGMRAAIAERLAAGRVDSVQCEYAYMARYRTGGGRVAWALDEHNVEFRLSETLARAQGPGRAAPAYRAYARRERALRRREELEGCRRMDAVFTVSGADEAHLRRELPGLPVAVAPNGVDLERFAPMAAPELASAVFLGKMDYRPNVDAVLWFCREILPRVRARRPDFTFRVVGPHPTPEVGALASLPGVSVAGRVDDPRLPLAGARLVLVPLRAGSGTRLKILEALAMERAVVTTALGCEGLGLRDGVHCRVADDAAGFADRVVELLGAPEDRRRLGAAGRRLVEERYSWSGAIDVMDAVHRGLVAGRRVPGRRGVGA